MGRGGGGSRGGGGGAKARFAHLYGVELRDASWQVGNFRKVKFYRTFDASGKEVGAGHTIKEVEQSTRRVLRVDAMAGADRLRKQIEAKTGRKIEINRPRLLRDRIKQAMERREADARRFWGT
jgi:hypothetical protein